MSSPANHPSLLDFPSSGILVFIFPILTFTSYFVPLAPAYWLSQPSRFPSQYLVPALREFLSYLNHGQRLSGQEEAKRTIALLTAIYIIGTYTVTATISSWGQLIGNPNNQGYKNREPRLTKRKIQSGMAHRMISSHEALVELFPAFAVTAALVAAFIPTSPALLTPGLDVAINALTLHVFLKLFVYVPAYIADVDLVRSMSHFGSINALLVALWSVVTA